MKELQENDQCDEIVCTTLSCIMFNVLWLMYAIDPEDPDKVNNHMASRNGNNFIFIR